LASQSPGPQPIGQSPHFNNLQAALGAREWPPGSPPKKNTKNSRCKKNKCKGWQKEKEKLRETQTSWRHKIASICHKLLAGCKKETKLRKNGELQRPGGKSNKHQNKKIYVAAGRMQRFNGLSLQFKVGPIYIKFYNWKLKSRCGVPPKKRPTNIRTSAKSELFFPDILFKQRFSELNGNLKRAYKKNSEIK